MTRVQRPNRLMKKRSVPYVWRTPLIIVSTDGQAIGLCHNWRAASGEKVFGAIEPRFFARAVFLAAFFQRFI